MRRLIRTIAILSLLVSSIAFYKAKHVPVSIAKIPATHYHGYNINHLSINKAKAFTVLISNEGFGGVGRGTGVLLDSRHVLTCAHMVKGPQDDLWIFPYPVGAVVKGRPVFVNRAMDLAILELNIAVIVPHYAVFQEMHYDGEPITIIGNTMGSMKWFVSFGIIGSDFEGYLLTDGVLYGGNSGGPWINEQGEVIALTDFTFIYHGAESGIHGGVAAKTINEFLRAWKVPSIEIILRMGDGR